VASLPASEGGEHPGLETIFLQRIYVLFFISLATRRIEYAACSSNPKGRWVTQQTRNLARQFADEHPFRFLIHDRDTKFSRAFVTRVAVWWKSDNDSRRLRPRVRASAALG
jgi:hypothetical protein